MTYKILFTTIFVFLFSACSFKDSSFNLEDELTQANLCQKLQAKDEKLLCYDKIKETNSYAQLRLGIYFFEKKDFDKAIPLLKQSNANKNSYSNLALAYSYYRGEGEQKDLKKAFKLLKNSASIDPNASYQLARFYMQGIETEKNTEKGLSLLEFAANKNMKAAQNQLYTIYSKGKFGIKKDSKKATYWDKLRNDKSEDLNYKIYQL